jgi:hypothetical protein
MNASTELAGVVDGERADAPAVNADSPSQDRLRTLAQDIKPALAVARDGTSACMAIYVGAEGGYAFQPYNSQGESTKARWGFMRTPEFEETYDLYRVTDPKKQAAAVSHVMQRNGKLRQCVNELVGYMGKKSRARAMKNINIPALLTDIDIAI